MTAIDTRAQATVKSAGAPSHLEDMWLREVRGRIEAEMKRLQVSIAKATQVCRWGRAKALQRRLTCETRSLIEADHWLEPYAA